MPIEYDLEVLKEIGSVIGSVLQVDSYTATSSRGSYARLCIQIDMDKPLITSIKVGRLVQRVMYEGISTLCFCCGRLGHKQEICPFIVRKMEKTREENVENMKQGSQEDSQLDPNYCPWVLVTRKKNLVRNGRARIPMKPNVGKVDNSKGKLVIAGTRLDSMDDDTP